MRSPRLNSLSAAIVIVLGAIVDAAAQEPKIAIKLSADYLALHLGGTTPEGTTRLEYRLAESDEIPEDAPWVAAEIPIASDGAFQLDLPLKNSRWSEVHLRALKGAEVLAVREARVKPREFQMLAVERFAELPDSDRAKWDAYMHRSNGCFENEREALAAECRKLGVARSRPAPASRSAFQSRPGRDDAWFTSAEARELANVIISYQTPTGGWSKAVDYRGGPRAPGIHWTSQSGDGWHYCGTLDNGSTTEQIRFLAAVHSAAPHAEIQSAVLRGIEWVFAAQFPNGAWPQNYPAEPGYHEAATLNDNALLHAMELMHDLAKGNAPFTFIDTAVSKRARESFDRALAWLAAAQVKVNGRATVWCAQHHPITLEPVAARKKEPPSLSGAESAEMLKFLMRKVPVSPATTGMVEPALEWLAAHRITGMRKTRNAQDRTDYVPDASSREVYWARFYNVQTGKPIFAGADDGLIYGTFSEMAAKNEVGYDYFTTKPAELLEKEMVRWRERAR